MNPLLMIAPLVGGIAVAFAWWKTRWIEAQDPGDATMNEIAELIREGAGAFLARQYKVLTLFVAFVATILALTNGRGENQTALSALSFIIGAAVSGLGGYLGMRIATKANVRTTAAARRGLAPALAVAFSGGSVMGMNIVGLGLIGIGLSYVAFTEVLFPGPAGLPKVLNALTGFSLGVSSIALFARLGGGIYTKAADVGADLVGKIESGLPEDDPRNPAVIADNVGDNVGDVAGMGADLFESFAGAILSTMVLGISAVSVQAGDQRPLLLPLLIASIGTLCSVAGTFLVRTKREDADPQIALDTGTFTAAALMSAATFVLARVFWPEAGLDVHGVLLSWVDVGLATAVGVATGVAIGAITSHYCSLGRGPVKSVAEQSKTGHATNILAGLGLGMRSTAAPILVIVMGSLIAAEVAGLYGVAIAALGMVSTTGIQLAIDAYGPIADNAGGIAEMSHQGPDVRKRTDKLDAVGNTTAAIGKGFAIGSTAMTALALFAAFVQLANIPGIDLSKPRVIGGTFVGAMLPFLFSSMAIDAVGKAAMNMIEEVRRQFREIPGLLEGTAKPDTARCVDISTTAALRYMLAPGALAIVSPVVVGLLAGPEALGGLLAGVTVSGLLLALFMSNAGGAWDNAKKSFEGDGYRMLDGSVHTKGSEAHKAAVVGDTVGDPFKDTAGPALNILVKLVSVVALVLAPFIALG